MVAVAAVATGLGACASGSGSTDAADGGLTPLRVGVLPYLDYHLFYVAHEMGFDKELGYDMSFTKYPLEPNETQSLARGDIDIAQGAIGSLVSQLPSQQDLRVFLSLSQYKGFAFVVREDSGLKTYQEYFDELGDADAAREAVVAEMVGKSLLTTESSYRATIAGLMDEGGKNYDDLNVQNFAEASQGAAAFIQGTGDIYLGAVAQTVKLVDQMEGYEVLIQDEEMGAPGLWYSNAYVTQGYLDENYQQLIDVTAIWYRTARYVAENPDEAYPIILKTLNPDTASNLTVDDLKSQIPDTTYFPTAEEAQELTFNDDTEMSWKKLTDYQFEQAEALGTDLSGITSDEFIVQDEIFDEFMADDKLQDYVNADF
ncbi:ABC transporter substrate-binding protein [Microbacterium sp.]|jgi:ABC-type nitrate/sulfonate/bicarbonate transport system substrate-binding protein|uniref:ABC transporter substrate-binding protein n=1 Tax=Microbacterium sp. TaxID=51671 RepID=UPI0037CBC853